MSCVFTYVASECKRYSAKWLSVTENAYTLRIFIKTNLIGTQEMLSAMAFRITVWQEEQWAADWPCLQFEMTQQVLQASFLVVYRENALWAGGEFLVSILQAGSKADWWFHFQVYILNLQFGTEAVSVLFLLGQKWPNERWEGKAGNHILNGSDWEPEDVLWRQLVNH